MTRVLTLILAIALPAGLSAQRSGGDATTTTSFQVTGGGFPANAPEKNTFPVSAD